MDGIAGLKASSARIHPTAVVSSEAELDPTVEVGPYAIMEGSERILLIQLRRIGDVVLTTPVADVLSHVRPRATLDFLTDEITAPLLETHPAIHRVLRYNRRGPWKTIQEVRRQRYDWVLDFQSNPRTALLTLLSGAKQTVGYQVPFWRHCYRITRPRPGDQHYLPRQKLGLLEALGAPREAWGAAAEDVLPHLVLREEDRRFAQSFFDSSNRQGQRWIGVVPTHRRAVRRWGEQQFAQAARGVAERHGLRALVFWGPGEKPIAESVVRQAGEKAELIPPTTLGQMAALLSRCDVVLANDNGPMHIAVALGVPTVTIYGPTHPRSWNPGGERHRAIFAEGLFCLHCNLNRCPYHHECMTTLKPNRVIEVAGQILAHRSIPHDVSNREPTERNQDIPVVSK